MGVLSVVDDLCRSGIPVLLTSAQRRVLIQEIANTGAGALCGAPISPAERAYSGRCVDLQGTPQTVENAQVLGTFGGCLLVEDLFGTSQAHVSDDGDRAVQDRVTHLERQIDALRSTMGRLVKSARVDGDLFLEVDGVHVARAILAALDKARSRPGAENP